MTDHPSDLIIRAACEDHHTFVRLLPYRHAIWMRIAMLAVLDRNPALLAKIAAFAMYGDSPDSIGLLLQYEGLRNALHAQWERLIAGDDCAQIRSIRASVVAAVADDALMAARVGGAMWSRIGDADRLTLARVVAAYPSCAASLMQSIGGAGWSVSPDEARATLLSAVTSQIKGAAESGSAVWEGMNDNERIRLILTVAATPSSAADFIERLGAQGWHAAPVVAKIALLHAISRDAHAAARGGAAVWGALDPDDRMRIIISVAQDVDAVPCFIDRLGPETWRTLPEAMRGETVHRLARSPWSAASAGGRLWPCLTDDERCAIAESAARHPFAAAALIAGMREELWRRSHASARAQLLNAAMRTPHAAAKAGAAIWMALTSEEQVLIAQAASACESDSPSQQTATMTSAIASADLMEGIGAAGWRVAPAAARAALARSVIHCPLEAARAAAAVWSAMNDDERGALICAVAKNASAISRLITSIGAEEQMTMPDEARQAILTAAWTSRQLAAPIGGVMWSRLNDDERRKIMLTANRDAEYASHLLLHIGPKRLASIEKEARFSLIKVAARKANLARRIADALWDALDDDERCAVVSGIVRRDAELSAWLTEHGVQAWRKIPDDARAKAISKLLRHVHGAARISGAVWAELRDDERESIIDGVVHVPEAAADLIAGIGVKGWDATPAHARAKLVNAVVQSPEAATQAFLVIMERLDDGYRTALVHASIRDEQASMAAAIMLREGRSWREWMTFLVPDEHNQHATREAWRAVTSRMPATVAAHVIGQRSIRRCVRG